MPCECGWTVCACVNEQLQNEFTYNTVGLNLLVDDCEEKQQGPPVNGRKGKSSDTCGGVSCFVASLGPKQVLHV